jgi:rSAM/selenodomain-associated transferase 2
LRSDAGLAMTISVIIPTLNEEQNISQRIDFIRQFGRDVVVEIIVVDGQSSDETRSLAAKAGAKVLIGTTQSRAAQMNHGARHASGEVLYFVHADVQLIDSFVKDVQEAFKAGFDAGCYRYRFDVDKVMLKVMAYFTRFDRIMCRGGDQTLFIKKDAYEALKGFDEYYTIMEDYDFIIRLKKKYKFKVIQKDLIVSARKYEMNSWFRVQSANLIIFIMFFLKKPPDQMKKMYKKLITYR